MADSNKYVAKSSLTVNLNRQLYGPLDVSQVFYSQADLDHYRNASTSGDVSDYWTALTPYPYPGLIVSLVSGTTVNVYMLVPTSTEINKDTVYNLVEITNLKTTITGTSPIIVDENNDVKHETALTLTRSAAAYTSKLTTGTYVHSPYVTTDSCGHITNWVYALHKILLDDGELT